MTIILPKILLAYACGLVDRIRGDKIDLVYSKSVEAFIYGAMVFAILGVEPWVVALGAALWLAGASFGWGEPLGAALEDRPMNVDRLEQWQVSMLARNVKLALIARGLIWGLCLTPIIYFEPKAFGLVIAMCVIFPLSVYAAKKMQLSYMSAWETQEVYRGWMSGVTALLLYLA